MMIFILRRDTYFPLNELFRTNSGDVIVQATTDETDPASVFPLVIIPGGVGPVVFSLNTGKSPLTNIGQPSYPCECS